MSPALSWPQIRLMQIIYEPFKQGATWPIFQHVNALAWHELKDPNNEPLEPRDVYFELSGYRLVRPQADRARTAQLREDTEVKLSLLGLVNLDEASPDLTNLVSAVRYIGERAQNFRPSDPTVAEHLRITSEEIRLTLRLDIGDRGLLRLARLLQGEASGIWSSFTGPDPGAGWSLDVETAIARRYAGAFTAFDLLAVQEELRRTYAPIPIVVPTGELEATEASAARRAPKAPRVFISYSHRDQEFVFALVEQLKRRGIRVWIDHVELVVGDSLISRVSDAIADGDFLVGVISEHSVRSPWCQKELALAMARGINEKRVTVLPIRLGDVDMPNFLTDVLYAQGDDLAEIAFELSRAIDAHLTRADIDPQIVPEGPQNDGADMLAGEAAPQPTSVPADDRISVAAILDQVGERVDDVLIEWDRCRNVGAATDDLRAEQRRLRTLLGRLPTGLQKALPITADLSESTWQDYFQARTSAEVEPDVREELRAVRSQVDRGLPIVARWRIVTEPEQVTSGGRDATAYLVRIERDRASREIVVYISGTAMATADAHLPAEVVAVRKTLGRSVVVKLLGVDNPPREVTVSTEGIRWD